MTAHVLDHPVRSALFTRHGHLAQGSALALRYRPEVSPFAAVAKESDEALAALATLIPPDGAILIAQTAKHPLPRNVVAQQHWQVVQMVMPEPAEPGGGPPFLELTDADAPDMLELATVTKPGPFLPRTHEFGGYIGIRENGRLVAMAGQRMQVPGFTEVSAVCTHPDFRGQGYAGFLTRVVASRVMAAGETPFLHTFASNANAIKLYEQLGFVQRVELWVSTLRHA